MILGVGLARRLKPGSLLLVDGGRVLVYASLALGLLVGRMAIISFGAVDSALALYSLCGIAITMLVATVLTPFREQESLESQLASALDPSVADKGKADSLREPVLLSEKNNETANGSKPQQTPVSSVAPEARLTEPSRTAAKMAPPQASSGRADTPWRRSCNNIAQRYKLSPRETEIFFLIAKGRNAEFVQQKLIISMHTAKTHIANIYHKLGVHSSQEMLSLVEAFREEESRSQNKERT